MKNFITIADAGAETDSMKRILNLIVEGVVLHAITKDDDEYAAFQSSVRDLARELESGAHDSSRMLPAAGAIIRVIDHYNRNLERQFLEEKKELQNIVSMLIQALSKSCRGDERALQGIQSVQDKLREASRLDDIRSLKVKLGGCLEELEAEAKERSASSAQLTDLLEKAEQMPAVRSAVAALADDPVTGLPGPLAAQRAMQDMLSSADSGYAAVLVVERLALVNSRFGYAAGDQLLAVAAAELRKKLRPADRLFRWNGPAFVVVGSSAQPDAYIRGEIARLASTRSEHTLHLDGRSVLLPVALSSLILPKKQFSTLEALVERIDQRVNGR